MVRKKAGAVLDKLEVTLKERGSKYGPWKEHARIAQNIKRAFHDSPNWDELSDDKKEALDMIAQKIGRILNGDPEYADSYVDISGYITLALRNLKQ